MNTVLPVAGSRDVRAYAAHLARHHRTKVTLMIGLHALAALAALAAPRLLGDLVESVENGTTASHVDKIIAVLENDAIYGSWTDLKQVPFSAVERLRHYFLTYKDTPGGKTRTAEITHIYGRNEAHDIIRRSQIDYQAHYGVVDETLNNRVPA